LDKQTNVTSNYTYDSIYQLLTAAQGGSTTESFSYDPVGNRTASLGVSSYTTNSSNELTAMTGASFTYDYNGNTTSKTVSSNTTNYSWDYENRLTSAALPGGGTVSFVYDPFGRRVKKVSSSGTSIFAYDGDNLIEETNSSGTVVARYSQGLNIDEPLAMLRSSTTSYYNADGLGSVTSLANTSGTLAQTYTFDSFGKQTASSGSLVNPFQYTARESDSETGLYYYRARYYDPVEGRFLSEDPLRFRADLGNFYEYNYADPTNFIDPYGMSGQSSGTSVQNPPTTGSPKSGSPSSPPRSLPPTRTGPIDPEPIPPVADGFPWGRVAGGVGIGIAIELFTAPTTEINDVLHTPLDPRPAPKAPPCSTTKECEKEWEEAFEDCRKMLKRPNAPNVVRGSKNGKPYNNLYDCARGLVSEACGGNPVDWGKNWNK
jgi:RHS repeat-associated protein